MASELGLSKGAVSKAIKVLDQMKLIDAELVKVKIRLKPSKTNVLEFPEGNGVSYSKQQFPIGNDGFLEETTVSYRKQQFPIGNDRCSEPLQEEDFSASKINIYYLEFLDSLSESERANFLKFCKEAASNLSQSVNDIEAWLAHKTKAGKNRWEVYYEKFLAKQKIQTKESKTSYDSQMKKFQQEIEQQRQQAEKAWQQSPDAVGVKQEVGYD
ncbi:hypothetical protein [Scytonema sp. NUACC21]